LGFPSNRRFVNRLTLPREAGIVLRIDIHEASVSIHGQYPPRGARRKRNGKHYEVDLRFGDLRSCRQRQCSSRSAKRTHFERTHLDRHYLQGRASGDLCDADIARVEYRDAVDSMLGQDYFLGEWEVGDGNSGTFFIRFNPNGEATRSLGSSHGIWAIAGEEARINWDDGWHDVIRKVGDAHEKFAFAPGTTLDDPPANVTAAWKLKQKNSEPKP
jgi:hypothetical protein